MQNQKQKILNAQQSALVAELCQTYQIDPDEIVFFENDPKPFFGYEATCVMLNQLCDFERISLEAAPSFSEDSQALSCLLADRRGHTRSAIGVVNLNESIDGRQMSEQQRHFLAAGRAIRNALRTWGVDLLTLHREAVSGKASDAIPLKSNFASLLAQAHALGQAIGYIVGNDKALWYKLLMNRYSVERSNYLTEDQLADLVAFLRTLRPTSKAQAQSV